jgi:hypothetical protein
MKGRYFEGNIFANIFKVIFGVTVSICVEVVKLLKLKMNMLIGRCSKKYFFGVESFVIFLIERFNDFDMMLGCFKLLIGLR